MQRAGQRDPHSHWDGQDNGVALHGGGLYNPGMFSFISIDVSDIQKAARNPLGALGRCIIATGGGLRKTID